MAGVREPPWHAFSTSIWVQRAGTWRKVFSQSTPVSKTQIPSAVVAAESTCSCGRSKRAGQAEPLWEGPVARFPEVPVEREGDAKVESVHEDEGRTVREGPSLVRPVEEEGPRGGACGFIDPEDSEGGRILDCTPRGCRNVVPPRLKEHGRDRLVEHIIGCHKTVGRRLRALAGKERHRFPVLPVLPVEPGDEEGRVYEGVFHVSSLPVEDPIVGPLVRAAQVEDQSRIEEGVVLPDATPYLRRLAEELPVAQGEFRQSLDRVPLGQLAAGGRLQ